MGTVRWRGNPVARSNVCPDINPPKVPSFHAFCFTIEATRAKPTFVIAGSGEATEGSGSYGERAVRRGETSPDAIREKACYVLGEMERRLGLLGFSWSDTTVVQIYTVHDIHPFRGRDRAEGRGPIGFDLALRTAAAARARVRNGLCRPPA